MHVLGIACAYLIGVRNPEVCASVGDVAAVLENKVKVLVSHLTRGRSECGGGAFGSVPNHTAASRSSTGYFFSTLRGKAKVQWQCHLPLCSSPGTFSVWKYSDCS